MIDWPESLIAELGERRCIVFIGAGASAACTRPATGGPEHPPKWLDFIVALLSRATRATPTDREEAQRMIDSGRLLEAAEIIKTGIHPADFGALITQTFRDYRATTLHQHLNQIDPKILITTNFDKVYEQYCQIGEGASGYVVHRYYDPGLVTRLRSPQRLVIKVHGCMDAPERTVLTKSEFFQARQAHPGFFRTIESLFLTHTLLFIGYSLSDPDIQLLLENSAIAEASAHPHYAVMPNGTHPSIRTAFKNTYNVEILDYDPADGHSELVSSLDALDELVTDFRRTHDVA